MMNELDKQNFTNYVEVKSFGDIFPKKGTNTRTPYEHQKKAMEALDKMNQEASYSTLVVLPTGGGKTYTASMWLLKNAIDKRKKILWIAHRQMLLDQAAESFQKFAYTEVVPHISSFCFRIVSGASSHGASPSHEVLCKTLLIPRRNVKIHKSCRLSPGIEGAVLRFLLCRPEPRIEQGVKPCRVHGLPEGAFVPPQGEEPDAEIPGEINR